jgi:NAD(P)-dependent dehydrogenase (short-subunit alcohol dehydrogenase family)
MTPLSERNLASRAAARGLSVDQMRAGRERLIPIGRANTPADIAAMALFLASPRARNITGRSYNVDGGLVPS